MTSPISTASLYAMLGAHIGTTQNQIAGDAAQVSSGKIATDLAGYGASAGQLTAVNSVASRLASYASGAQSLSARLGVQGAALNQVATAAQGATSAVQEALADNDASDLMTTLQSQLASASSALNTQYDGQYLFAGGNASTAPMAASSLSDLTSANPPSSIFTNGALKSVGRLDDSTTVETGVLANDVGSPLMNALAAVKAYSDGPNGPLTGALTATQASFLSGVLSQFKAAVSSATTTAADNGVVQKQVSDASTRLAAQQTTIQGVISSLTVPDEAQVASDLTLAQTTLQASAQVFSSLQSASLLQVLSST